MKIKTLLSEKENGHVIHTIDAAATLLEVVKKLNKYKIGALIVTAEKDGKESYIGIITERNIIREMEKGRKDLLVTKVTAVMTKDVIVATPNDDIETVMAIMTRHKIRHIPIIENAQIVGMVSIGDIIQNLNQQAEITISHLSDYVGVTAKSKVY